MWPGPPLHARALAVLGLCGLAGRAAAVSVEVPFARAALFASELPQIRGCDAGLGPSCSNPYAAMAVWRYAVNNLRRAVDLLPEGERQMHKSTVAWVAQISAEVEAFYQQPTEEALAVAIGNTRQVFQMLSGWMGTSPPNILDFPEPVGVGVPFLPRGRSLRLPADASARPGDAEVRLANGVEMPVLGFGTWQLVGQHCYEATIFALRTGYRHIDTAQAYANEAAVGKALADSGVPRREIFLATKLSDPADFGPEALVRRFEAQLRDLGVDYVDLYMLHTPGPGGEATRQAWAAMERLYDAGRIRALGVSNFGAAELEGLLAVAQVPPVYVQNKFSVYNPGEQQVSKDSSIMQLLRTKGITMMAYSVINPWPFMLPPMKDPHVLAVAQRVGRTPSQVLHRWALQLGAGVIPKSGDPGRIAENARLFDFALSDVDMRLLSGIVTLSESSVSALAPSWADDIYKLGVGVRVP